MPALKSNNFIEVTATVIGQVVLSNKTLKNLIENSISITNSDTTNSELRWSANYFYSHST